MAHKSNNPLANGEDCRLGLRVFIQGILDACCINASFDLIPEKDFPQWALGKNEGMNTLVVCRNCANKKSSVESFRGKPAFVYVNDLFWFEENLAGQSPSDSQLGYPPPEYHASSKVALPKWLDSFLFETLGASFQPSKSERGFNCNLNSSQEKALTYAGTYLPRSYAECYCIFDDLLHTPEIKKALNPKTSLTILSVGSGTCGDALGTLSAIDKNLPGIRRVSFIGIEGNKPARDIAKQLIHEAKQHYRFEIDFRSEDYTIENFTSYLSSTCILHTEGSVDILLSSKMVSEMVSTEREQSNQAYSNFLISFLPLLSSEIGICLLLDVATRTTEEGPWFPVLMNAQTVKTLKEMPEFKIIAPSPCRELNGLCSSDSCYSQRKFEVSHSRKSCDCSKVNYRIISRTSAVAFPSKQPIPCLVSPPTQYCASNRAPCSSRLESTCEKNAFPINP